jgi:DNA/RNA-binding domain of Phe-tRNA-synthetase-like protein
MIEIAPHERLLARAFLCRFERPLGELPSSQRVLGLLRKQENSPLVCNEGVRTAVRSLLRWGGFKPTGRSKPASEYLEKAFQDGFLQPINAAVDACNAVSLHSGLPISVIDVDLAQGPYRLEVVADKLSYVFNPSGQELDLKGLICLWDSQGPCASPVKDSQRTKTHADSRNTLCLLWGSQELPAQVEAATRWYQELLTESGALLGPSLVIQ